MIPWNTLRTVAAVLILLPLVHLALLLSRDTLALLSHTPEVWANEVAAYADADNRSALPEAPVVVVGGRWVRHWTQLPDFLAPRPVLMRGLGQATVDDLRFHHDRLIAHYQPSAVVILPGMSDFHLRDSKSPEELADAVLLLVREIHAAVPEATVHVIPPLHSPLYASHQATLHAARELLEQALAPLPRAQVLDTGSWLQEASGDADPRYYHSDGITLNELGYLRLCVLVESALDSVASR